MEETLIKTLLDVKATDHRKIQEEIKNRLERQGWEVKLEKKIWAEREGKIDVFARKGNYTMGLEVDHSQMRNKSIRKLNYLKPDLAVFFMKAKDINLPANYTRARQIKVNAVLIHSYRQKAEKIGPSFQRYEREDYRESYKEAPKQRYKKFERGKAPSFRITETDEKILRNLADYRFLGTNHIQALHSEVPETTLKTRLKFLYQSGFLDRPIGQSLYQKSQTCIIYSLGGKGAEFLFADDRASINRAKRNREIKPQFLEHELMISNFRVVLALALKQKRGVKLARWQQGKGLGQKVYSDGNEYSVFPDAFFTIEDKKDYLHYFLEADRSTMKTKEVLDKMRGYWQWWKQEGHQYKFSISVFRVLTITISEKRKENLRLITKQANDNRKGGSEMFLFACEKDYSLEKPESVLKPIWQSPKDDKPHHLLE